MRQVRRDPNALSRYIPIIINSAYTEVQHVLTSRDAGADQFLAKPFTVKMVFHYLKTVVDNQPQFVRCKAYFGHDRRRKKKPAPDGWERRGAKPKTVEPGPGSENPPQVAAVS